MALLGDHDDDLAAGKDEDDDNVLADGHGEDKDDDNDVLADGHGEVEDRQETAPSPSAPAAAASLTIAPPEGGSRGDRGGEGQAPRPQRSW